MLGSQDLEHHIATQKHKKNLKGCSSTSRIDTLFQQQQSTAALTHRVLAGEAALAFHTVRHHFSYRSMDCTPKLNGAIFFDSEVAKKISIARTKTECIINNVIAPHALDITVECLNGISCFGVSTDASNHGCVKLFPIVIQYFDYKLGGIKTKVVELKSTPNETSETIAGYITETLQNLGIANKCIAFTGDNANTNFGGKNRKEGNNVYSRLKKSLNDNLVGVGCPAHILHNAIQHGADSLSIDVECLIMKMYNYFSIYTVRTEELKSFCKFVDINYKQLLSHSKTRWLSLFPGIERVLEMYDGLKSYFLSACKPPKILVAFFENKLGEAYLWHLHSLMSIFQSNIMQVEREDNSVLEIMEILDIVCQVLQNRLQGKFICLKVKEKLENARKEGFDKEANVFMDEAMLLYKSCYEYLKQWILMFDEFVCFKWMALKSDIDYCDVEKSIVYLQDKCKSLQIDDVKTFDQFHNLKQFLNESSNDPEFIKLSCSQKWAKYFNSSKSVDCCSELLKLAEYFFSIPGHNANVERVFSLITTQWTDDRNRFKVESVKSLLLVQYNLKEFTCVSFYKYMLDKPKLLKEIGSSEKYQ